MKLLAPAQLAAQHQLGSFACSEPVLDHWLQHRSLANQGSGASRTFVVSDEALHVMGYYALAAGALAHENATATSARTCVRGLLLHALNDKARNFHEHYGFRASPVNGMTLMVRLPQLA